MLLLVTLAYIGLPVSALIDLPIHARQRPRDLKRSEPGPKSRFLYHHDGAYGVDVKIGQPPQTVELYIMTADSKTWIANDYFLTNKSKSLSAPKGQDIATYGDPTTYPPSNDTIHFDLYEDKFEIADTKICKQTFGVTDEYSDVGLLGLGPDLHRGYQPGSPYNTVLDSLAAQRAIPGRAFSVDLRPIEANKGALTFGGADTGRFEGKLVKRPLVKDELGTFGPSVVLSGYGQTAPNGTKFNYDVPKGDEVITIDSGNQYFRFRHSIADPLFRDLGAVNDGNDAYYAPCSKRDEPGTWDFHFGEVTIKVPYKNFITEEKDDSGKNCFVGVLTTWKGQLRFGVIPESFMQAAYLSYDYDNKVVGMAPSADCKGKLVPFTSGPNAIPDLTGCKAK
ncbi:aspartic peptidase domain-containing protein [Colletotrichum cereale]|nr:aspartic peptidase domain-containing protein [Colletotrichum cereale]